MSHAVSNKISNYLRYSKGVLKKVISAYLFRSQVVAIFAYMHNASKNKKTEKVNQANNDFWNELPTEVKRAIKVAQKQLDKGEGIPHKQVMAEIKSRFL